MPNHSVERTAAALLRSTLGINSCAPFTLDLAFPAAVAQLCVRPWGNAQVQHTVQKGRFAGEGALFRPDGLTPCTFPWSNGGFCNDGAFACLDSGLVWSSIASLDRLRKFISKRCKQER